MADSQTKSYGKGAVICREGESAECLYILRKGRVAVEVSGESIRPVVVASIVDPGAIVGEAGLFLGRRTATLRAIDNDTRLQEVPFEKGGIRKLIEQRPDTGYKLCHSLALRLRNLSEKMRSVSEATQTVHLLYDSLALSYRGLVNSLNKAEERDRSLRSILAAAMNACPYADAQRLREKIKSNQNLFALALGKKTGSTLDLAPGGVLLQQGELGRMAYLVEAGAADVYIGGHRVATLGPGELVGVTALLLPNPVPGTSTIIASESARVVAISSTDFESMAKSSPEFLFNLAESFCRRIESTNMMACNLSKAIEAELDLLSGSPRSCDASFKEVARQLVEKGGYDELVENALSQAERAVKARERMTQTYSAFL